MSKVFRSIRILTRLAFILLICQISVAHGSAGQNAVYLEEIWQANGKAFSCPINLQNEDEIAHLVVPLFFWPDADLTVDSISVSGARLEALGVTTTWFDNVNNLLWIDFTADPGNPLPAGDGALAGIFFRTDQNATNANVDINTMFIPPDKAFYFEDEGGSAVSVAFRAGVIHIVTQVPIIDIDPEYSTFETIENIDPEPKHLSVFNIGINPLNWHISSKPPWLQTSIDFGTAPSEIILSPIVAGLPAGIYFDSLAITDSLSANHTRWAMIEVRIGEEPGPDIDTVCIDLAAGWNLISWNVDTDNDEVESIITDVVDCVDVILGFEWGSATYDPDLPQFSTLDYMDHMHGYWFRMDCPAQICLIGHPVDPQTPIALEPNWNLVSYLPVAAYGTEEALGSVLSDLVVALGYDNGGLTYETDHPELATLLTLDPTFGYWLKTTTAANLVYPGAVPENGNRPSAGQTMKASPIVAGVQPTREWSDFYGDGIRFDNRLLEVGTMISFYDEAGVLCGAGEIEIAGVLPFVPVYGDDPETPSDEGAERGSEIHIRVNGVEAAETYQWAGIGERTELAPLNSAKGNDASLPDQFELSQNYPNPFNPATVIRFSLPVATQVRVEVYNVLGERIRTLIDQYLSAGNYRVSWDGTLANGEHAPSAIYFYRLSAGDVTVSKKMLLVK